MEYSCGLCSQNGPDFISSIRRRESVNMFGGSFGGGGIVGFAGPSRDFCGEEYPGMTSGNTSFGEDFVPVRIVSIARYREAIHTL
jgi:hypothetical protein